MDRYTQVTLPFLLGCLSLTEVPYVSSIDPQEYNPLPDHVYSIAYHPTDLVHG